MCIYVYISIYIYIYIYNLVRCAPCYLYIAHVRTRFKNSPTLFETHRFCSYIYSIYTCVYTYNTIYTPRNIYIYNVYMSICYTHRVRWNLALRCLKIMYLSLYIVSYVLRGIYIYIYIYTTANVPVQETNARYRCHVIWLSVALRLLNLFAPVWSG